MSSPVGYLMDLLRIAGEPGDESQVASYLCERLHSLGIPESSIVFDEAQKQSEMGGNSGNLIVDLNGHGRGERLLFGAHMDTVPMAVGAIAHLESERIMNRAPEKALGGDNRTGCAVLLSLARELAALKGNHAPVTLAFFVQEKIGLVGSRGLDLSKLGSPLPSRFYNFDSGNIGELITAVTGAERFHIEIEGHAVHAGVHPKMGVSSAIIAAKALSELAQQGWHGAIEKPEGRGSANAGIIKGGTGSNVVMGQTYMLAEARSHSLSFRKKIISTWQEAFERAARTELNIEKKCGRVKFSPGPVYEAFATPEDSTVIQSVHREARKLGIQMKNVSSNGGMDANRIAVMGIPSLTIGCGQREVHTSNEWIDVKEFLLAVQLAIPLAVEQQ